MIYLLSTYNTPNKGVQFDNSGSEHVGGAHFGMGDGSVRFISQNIKSRLSRTWGRPLTGSQSKLLI